MDCVEEARQGFAQSRQLVEHNLAALRAQAQAMLEFRHARRRRHRGLLRLLIWPLYLWDKRILVPLLKETRCKLQLCRKVENDLSRGELDSAIEALSAFFAPAPGEETDPVNLEMLRLCDDLRRASAPLHGSGDGR